MIHRPLRHPAPEALRHPQGCLRRILPVPAPREAAEPVVVAQAAAVLAVLAQGGLAAAELAARQRAQARLPACWGPQTIHGCTSHISRCVPRPQEGPRSA